MLSNFKDIETHCGDQEDREFLKKIGQRYSAFDVIIDDGGHLQSQQQISFGALFPFVKSGGIYVIEDLTDNVKRKWKQNYNPTATKKTTLYVCENLKNKNIIDSDFITSMEADYIEKNFSFCDIISGKKNQEIVFIGKK